MWSLCRPKATTQAEQRCAPCTWSAATVELRMGDLRAFCGQDRGVVDRAPGQEGRWGPGGTWAGACSSGPSPALRAALGKGLINCVQGGSWQGYELG